jgi:parvulin-like peptidyl-prolyl isomerase
VFIDLYLNKKPNKIKKDFFVNIVLLATFFSFSLLFKIPTSTASTSQKVFVIAKVDNQAITNLDLKDRFLVITKMSKVKIDSFLEKQIVLNQILQKMIDEELQIKEAKSLGIGLDQEKFYQVQLEISHSYDKEPAELKKFFQQKSSPYDSFLKQIRSKKPSFQKSKSAKLKLTNYWNLEK